MPKPSMTRRSSPRPTGSYWQLRNWLSKYGSDNKQLEHGVARLRLATGTKPKVLTMPQPPLHHVVTDKLCPDDDYNNDNVFAKMIANRQAPNDDSKLGKIKSVYRCNKCAEQTSAIRFD